MLLQQLTWPDLKDSADLVCVLPLGATEQHGPHLPLWTDAAIIGEIAWRAEVGLKEQVMLAPVQNIGHSPHHQRFGSLSLDLPTYVSYIKAACRSIARMGFQRIFLLNGHGGNDVPCRAALSELKCEIPDVAIAFASYWTLAAPEFNSIRSSPAGGMGHACEMETSIMLHLYPDQVRLDRAKDDGTAGEKGYRLLDMLRPQPYFMVRDFHELSGTGTLGMPSHASADKGERFLSAAVAAVSRFLAAFASGELDIRHVD
jgi:creatinine amidohydrolase